MQRIGDRRNRTADKGETSPHYAAMQLTCPDCQTQYELDTEVHDLTLLCQRCGHEFPKQTDTSIERSDTDNAAITEPAFPERQRSHLLPWFMIILTLLAAAGFWFQYDAWMDQRWLRSTIISLGFTLPSRDKDWVIVSDSIRPTWLTRSDGNKVLVIKGQVKNLLSSSMPPPRIEIIFFDKIATGQRIASQLLDITDPPSEQAMLQPSYPTPAIDNKAIAGLTTRQFVFLIDSLPANTGDFSLNAKSR